MDNEKLIKKYKERIKLHKKAMKNDWDKQHKSWLQGRIAELELVIIDLE